MKIDRTCFIEELAANAWPAEVIQIVDGWRLRFNHGVSRRANSVWPNENGGRVPVEIRLALVEDFYTRRALPARYHICPACLPVGLDDVLETRGYTVDALTSVQTANITTVLTHMQPSYESTYNENLTDAWFDGYINFGGYGQDVAAIVRNSLEHVGPRSVYVVIEEKDQCVSVGRGVFERGWVGVFSMATNPEFRCRGYATTVLHALALWGQASGASQMYLQVEIDNAPALALYTRAGFEKFYQYHYRQSPS